MPNFGSKSKKQLSTCHPRLQELLKIAIKIVDFSVIKGHRGQKEQDDCFNRRASKVKFPDSRHNKYPSHAADIAPYPIDFKGEKELLAMIPEADRIHAKAIIHNIERWALTMGILKGIAHMINLPIRTGIDWDGDGRTDDQTFDDRPHVELRL